MFGHTRMLVLGIDVYYTVILLSSALLVILWDLTVLRPPIFCKIIQIIRAAIIWLAPVCYGNSELKELGAILSTT